MLTSFALRIQSGFTSSFAWATGRRKNTFSTLAGLFSHYSISDAKAEATLASKVKRLNSATALSDDEAKWLYQFKKLSELRGLVFGKTNSVLDSWQQASLYHFHFENLEPLAPIEPYIEVSLVTSRVVGLYRNLFEALESKDKHLATLARKLAREIFKEVPTQSQYEALLELMEGNGTYLILNLLRRGQIQAGRDLARLYHLADISNDSLLALYWFTELFAFTPVEETDHHAVMRKLYHYCFTQPERAGFLEIDSRFYSEFSLVNETAEEGFLFKETLVDQILALWAKYQGYFDGQFQSVLFRLVPNGPLVPEQSTWQKWWSENGKQYCEDFLSVVEGNFAFIEKDFSAAAQAYQRALSISPRLQSASFNLLFAYAALGRWNEHQALSKRISNEPEFFPQYLHAIGNSYEANGKSELAEPFFNQLKKVPGWENKTDFYRSTFCYEHGQLERATLFAKSAFDAAPADSARAIHYSACLHATGNAKRALEVISNISSDETWLAHYRFTLQRDSGDVTGATQTLMELDKNTLDENELAAAMSFAKRQGNLVLLRHLKS